MMLYELFFAIDTCLVSNILSICTPSSHKVVNQVRSMKQKTNFNLWYHFSTDFICKLIMTDNLYVAFHKIWMVKIQVLKIL